MEHITLFKQIPSGYKCLVIALYNTFTHKKMLLICSLHMKNAIMKNILHYGHINTMKRTPIPVGTSHRKQVDSFKPVKSLLLL